MQPELDCVTLVKGSKDDTVEERDDEMLSKETSKDVAVPIGLENAF